jgi:phosphatidylserine/phosphatidylglycerophosphate/cardiolipin synthase-like enzyme
MIHGPWERFLKENNQVLTSGKTRIIFFPRSRRSDFLELFAGLGAGCSLRMAISHLNDKDICRRLFALAGQGVHVEILAHDTQRRVPAWVEKQMLKNGIIFNRYIHPDGLPMHNKFMLIDTPKGQTVTVGSMNLSVRSLHANHELLLVSEDSTLYQTFLKRWSELLREV